MVEDNKNRTSKFEVKSLSHMVNILEMVKHGKIAADIARTLNMSESLISYYITKGKRQNYIKQVTRSSNNILELTQCGQNFLDKYTTTSKVLVRDTPTKLYNGSSTSIPIPILRLENIQFKTKILQMPTTTIPVDWKKIEMNNWTQHTSQIDDVHVRLNDGAIPTLILLPSPVEGDDPFQLYTIVVCACYNAILELHNKIGLEVGSLEISSRPEWVVY